MKITKEMRDRKEERISQMVDRVNKDIKMAVERKQNSACFAFDVSDEFYFEVKKKFLGELELVVFYWGNNNNYWNNWL